ncbi:MAG: hypothetical protein V3V05_09720, partial [Pontiella sp.]
GWWGNLGHPNGSPNQAINVAKSRIMLGIYLDDKALFQSGYDHLFNTMYNPRNINPGLGKAEIPWPTSSPIDKDDPMSLFSLSIDYDGEHTEISRSPAPNSGHVRMDVEALNNISESLFHQGYDMYDMKIKYRTSASSPWITDAKPRYLLNADWMVDAADPGVRMKLHPSRDIVVVDYLKPVCEAIYNHYKYRSSGGYDISKLEAYVMAKRAAGNNGLDTLLHADLDKGLQRTVVVGTVIGVDFGQTAPNNGVGNIFNGADTGMSGSIAAGSVVDMNNGVVDGVSFTWSGAQYNSNATADSTDLPGQPAIYNDSNLTDFLLNKQGTTITLTFSGLDDSLIYNLNIGGGFTAFRNNGDTLYAAGGKSFTNKHDDGALAWGNLNGLTTDGSSRLVITVSDAPGKVDEFALVSALTLTAVSTVISVDLGQTAPTTGARNIYNDSNFTDFTVCDKDRSPYYDVVKIVLTR